MSFVSCGCNERRRLRNAFSGTYRGSTEFHDYEHGMTKISGFCTASVYRLQSPVFQQERAPDA
jgi:hypothetical protein